MGQSLIPHAQQELIPAVHTPPLRAIEHHLLPDAESVYNHLNQAGQLKSFQPNSQPCEQLAGHMGINDVKLLSYCGSGADFVVEVDPLVSLVATFSGTFSIRDSTGEVRACAGDSLLVGSRSGTRHYSSNGRASGAALFMEAAAIRRAAATMAGLGPEHQWKGGEEWSLPLQALSPLQANFLFSLLEYINACASVDPQLPFRLGLDDLVLRQAAGLLEPELLASPQIQSSPAQNRRSRQAFDELLDYIRANLDQPLRLSDLEARSFYSRRSLQYAFREKLHTTPLRWIREQRLSKAKKELEREGTALSIQAVALSCGYRKVSQFSADFKRRFGLTPSQVKRPSLR